MFPTALIYSSHNRCAYIHRDWIVERALKSHDNKTILYLPTSMGEMHQQEYGWGTFRWYFDQFRDWGLISHPFYWRPELSQEDVAKLFDCLARYEVVILGGGSTTLGMERYKQLGEQYFGDENIFGRILHDRQKAGKLTVGFSAGADQLCSTTTSGVMGGTDPRGFGLVRDVMSTLHYEYGGDNDLISLATQFPHTMIFGLPNDSGLAVDQGYLPSGNFWQVIEFLIDSSWDIPEDGWHVKTRQGMKIKHFYSDGRDYTFDNNEKMVRIISPDGHYNRAWIQSSQGFLDYWSQSHGEFHNVEHVLHSH